MVDPYHCAASPLPPDRESVLYVWCDQCDNGYFIEEERYILRGTNLLNASRGIKGKKTDKEYWNKEEHITVADLLIKELGYEFNNI